eukprot:6182958-Pleurochrysis_carterae.AAC.3
MYIHGQYTLHCGTRYVWCLALAYNLHEARVGHAHKVKELRRLARPWLFETSHTQPQGRVRPHKPRACMHVKPPETIKIARLAQFFPSEHS